MHAWIRPRSASTRAASRARLAHHVPLALGLVSALGFAACATESKPGTSGGATGTTSGGPQAEGPIPPAIAAQTGAQRLSVAQYRNAIHDIFGEDVVVPPQLEPDQPLDGLVAIGSSFSTISPLGVERYEDAAYKIAAQATKDHKDAVVPCTPNGTKDAECAGKFASIFGRKVWRRPLSADEAKTVSDIVVAAADKLGDFYKGIEFGIAALLQSPNFLYRSSVGEADPANAGKKRYTAYEMASRLSFFFWNSTPDDELLDAAENGALVTDKGLAEQALRLLDSPRAKAGLRNFVTEWLGLAELDTLSKDPKVYTYYTPDLGPVAREETLRDFEWLVFDQDGDFRDILTTRHTFVNPKLASMYMVPAPTEDGFGEVVFPDELPRVGLLGQISILSLYSHPTSSSSTLRGKFVRTHLLCQDIPPPPVNVNPAIPEVTADVKTLKQRMQVHMTDPVCRGCHMQMEPIGLGFENFDGVGRYRTKDNDADIDSAGDFDGQPFKDSVELAGLIRERPEFPACVTKTFYQYATGFAATDAEADVLTALTEDFKVSGYRMKTLMLALANSPGFRLASDPK